MDVRDAFEHARFLAARGQLSEAQEAADLVLAQEPLHIEALLLKARVFMECREDQDALALLERAVAAAPGSPEALNGLARCLHVLGRDTEALQVAERARDVLGEGDNFRQTAPVYLTMVWCLRSLKRLREALAVAEQGLARTPDSVLAQWASVVEEELADSEPDVY